MGSQSLSDFPTIIQLSFIVKGRLRRWTSASQIQGSPCQYSEVVAGPSSGVRLPGYPGSSFYSIFVALGNLLTFVMTYDLQNGDNNSTYTYGFL